jgi:hypothetical protein
MQKLPERNLLTFFVGKKMLINGSTFLIGRETDIQTDPQAPTD